MNERGVSIRTIHPDVLHLGRRLMLIGLGLLFCICTYAQFFINGIEPKYDQRTRSFLISIPKNYWGKDYQATITLASNTTWKHLVVNNQSIIHPVVFNHIQGEKSYPISVDVDGKTNHYTLSFTFLPILHLSGEFNIDYSLGVVEVQSPHQKTQVMNAEIKWRGGATSGPSKHKHNYKIKFVDEQGEKKNYSFFSLRNDNKWILDAGQVDLFRLRNLIAGKIWNDFATKPYYSVVESDVYTASRGEVVELFLNDEYLGIYNFCEPIDRKQLKLRKYNETSLQIHGGLWKAAGWGYATFMNNPKAYDNSQPTWDVFELKYPKLDEVCPSDYSTLYNAIKFVRTSKASDFSEQIGDYIDIPVFVDYYLFVNVFNAFDLAGKNLYWAVYDKQHHKRITLALWDLDSTVGQNYTNDPLHPDYVAWNSKPIVPTNIASRLFGLNVKGFKQKVINRYIQLRQSYFSFNYLANTYRHYYDLIKDSGAATREEQRWSGDSDISFQTLNFEEELSYITDWLDHRLEFLDKYFTDEYGVDIYASINDKYAISGMKVDRTYKGIIIIKGKKYLVK